MNTHSGRIERTFTFGPGATPRIVANNGSGSVAVRGEAREDVAVVVTVEPPDALERGLEIRIVQEGDTVTVEPFHTGGLFGIGTKGVRILMDIRTPHRSDAAVQAGSANAHVSDLTGTTTVQAGSGSVQANGLRGNVQVESGSGTVRVRGLSEHVLIGTGSGGIEAHDLCGEASVRTGSGGISVEGGAGTFVLQSGSGSVRLRDLTGTLDCVGASGNMRALACAFTRASVRTASGSIRLATPLDPAGEYRFETASGGVEVQVPEGTRATVTYTTMSGGITSDLPNERDGGKRSGTLRVNGGGVPVTMRSMSGSLALRVASEPLPASGIAATASASPAPLPEAWSAPEPAPEPPPPDAEPSETLRVLQAVERGELSIDEAMTRLAALEGAEA